MYAMMDTRTTRSVREEIEERGGRARVWLGWRPERIEVWDSGHTPEWALRGSTDRVEVDVGLGDEGEDWWPDVEARLRHARSELLDSIPITAADMTPDAD